MMLMKAPTICVDSPLEALERELLHVESGTGRWTLFHGTNLFRARSIIPGNLLPRGTTNLGGWGSQSISLLSQPKLVYLTQHAKTASNAAISVTNLAIRKLQIEGASKRDIAIAGIVGALTPVIIATNLPEDTDNLRPDEDSDCLSWKTSLTQFGSVGYAGTIPGHQIVPFAILPYKCLEYIPYESYDEWESWDLPERDYLINNG